MEKVELSVELVNTILGYLSQQRFMDVAGLITKIQAEAGPQVQKKEEE